MNAPPGNAVSTGGLTKSYGSTRALKAMTLDVPAGAIFGLLGRNGAGKSTAIKVLTTLLPPTSGSAIVAGFDIARDPVEVRRHIGYVPQMPSADGDLTGDENLLLFAKLYAIPARERRERIDEVVAFMGLSAHRDVLVGHYSGGTAPPRRDRPIAAPSPAGAVSGRADRGTRSDRTARALGPAARDAVGARHDGHHHHALHG
jgi:ABC-2 type transport system ATP-binding protein